MADPAVAALNSLLRSTAIDDHDEALKLSTAALVAAKKTGGDALLTAQRARVAALLKLDKFPEALRTIDEGGAALAPLCVLERAYALYKTGELDAAEKVLREAGVYGGDRDGGSRGLKHVTAQVAYRAENFEAAAEIYKALLEEKDEGRHGEENDLRINLLAASAQLEWQGKGWAVAEGQKQPGREDMEAFETAYNAACGCTARGDYGKAAVLLKRARDLCQASEDLSDEDKKTELVPIVVQQAYVLTKLGKADEAMKLQSSITLPEIPDASTRAVASNNSSILKISENPYLAERLASLQPKQVAANDKLFEYQASVLHRNKYVIELEAQKFQGVKESTTKILSKAPVPATLADKTGLGVIRAAAHCQFQTDKAALHSILPLLESHPDDIGLLLTIIQLYVQLSRPALALDLLELFFKRLEAANTPDHADVRFAPGLVAVAVSLYRLQGRPATIRSELARAAAHWQEREKDRSGTASSSDSLLREAGIELLRSSNPADLEAAGHAFEQLVRTHPDDRAAAAGLVASLATTDFAKVQPYLDALTPVAKLVSGVDVDALLSAGVPPAPPPPTQAQASKKRNAHEAFSETQGKGKGQAQPEQATKKRRRNKPAKNFEEGRTPDPERWLPLRDRSSYRPKGKKGKKRAAEATQGGPVRGEQETLELAGGAGSVKVERAPAGGQSGGGGGGGGKKKKKGKK